MTEIVSLITTHLKTGEKVITKGYDREMLEKWINHARAESAEGVLSWEVSWEED